MVGAVPLRLSRCSTCRAEWTPQSASSKTRDSARASTSTNVPGRKSLLSHAVSTMSSPPRSRVIQTLPVRQEILPPTREINALCPSFRELMKAGIGSWPERDLLVLRAYERAGNFPHPTSSLALKPGRPARAMIEQWRSIQLGNEAIAAAVTKRTGRSLLAK